MKSNLYIIVKHGWSYIAYALLALIIFMLLGMKTLAFLAFVTLGLFIYLFRNPERELSTFGKESIVSPVDGVVTQIVTLEDDKEYAYRVDIVSSYLDVSLLRVPMNSTLETMQIRKGTRVSQESKLFHDLNESCEMIFVNDDMEKIKVVHTLTQSFVPFVVDVIKGEKLHQTSRYGFMAAGLTSIYLPNNVRVNVNLMNELKASETLIGYFS